jgi:hypothetical protein
MRASISRLRFWPALLDARNGALAGAEEVGEVGLGHSLMTPRIPDEVADACQVVIGL